MKPGNCCSRGVQKVARTLQDLLTIPTPQIIVAQHHDRGLGQVGPEHTLAARVERIAVDERENRVTAHGHERCNAQRPIPRSHPLP